MSTARAAVITDRKPMPRLRLLPALGLIGCLLGGLGLLRAAEPALPPAPAAYFNDFAAHAWSAWRPRGLSSAQLD